jgi:hypothetical protein
MHEHRDELDGLSDMLEALEEADLPRFQLHSQPVELPRQYLPTEGYQIETVIHAMAFRFTALPFLHRTIWYVGCERWNPGQHRWSQDRITTPQFRVVAELFRRFAGFISAVVDTEPTLHSLHFRSRPDDRSARNCYRKAVHYLAKRLHATSSSHLAPQSIEYTITLPERTPP